MQNRKRKNRVAIIKIANIIKKKKGSSKVVGAFFFFFLTTLPKSAPSVVSKHLGVSAKVISSKELAFVFESQPLCAPAFPHHGEKSEALAILPGLTPSCRSKAQGMTAVHVCCCI